MNYLKINLSMFLLISSLSLTGCAKPIVISTYIAHPEGFLITPGEHVGPYKSLGTIYIADSEFGMGCLEYSVVHQAMSFLAYDGKPKTKEKIETFLRERLVVEAKKMGANAIIKVSYSYNKTSMCLGPVVHESSVATGEAVVIKRTKK